MIFRKSKAKMLTCSQNYQAIITGELVEGMVVKQIRFCEALVILGGGKIDR